MECCCTGRPNKPKKAPQEVFKPVDQQLLRDVKPY